MNIFSKQRSISALSGVMWWSCHVTWFKNRFAQKLSKASEVSLIFVSLRIEKSFKLTGRIRKKKTKKEKYPKTEKLLFNLKLVTKKVTTKNHYLFYWKRVKYFVSTKLWISHRTVRTCLHLQITNSELLNRNGHST